MFSGLKIGTGFSLREMSLPILDIVKHDSSAPLMIKKAPLVWYVKVQIATIVANKLVLSSCFSFLLCPFSFGMPGSIYPSMPD